MSTLIQVFSCRENGNLNYNSYRYYGNIRLLYTFMFEDREVSLSQWREVSTTLVADWLREGANHLNISVCISNNASTPSCIPHGIPRTLHLQNVEITVAHNTLKLFPYGGLTRDSSFHGVTHGVVEYSPPEDIPFFSGYYRSIHVRIVYRQDFWCKIIHTELVVVASSCAP